jgi:uncharacterized OsmC-like protein
MRVVLEGEHRLRLEVAGDGFEITSEGASISPYHLLAASLASCTALTVSSWADGAGIAAHTMVIAVVWEMAADKPKRITRVEQTLRWPELPADRIGVVHRLARLCPIETTLERGTTVISVVHRD